MGNGPNIDHELAARRGEALECSVIPTTVPHLGVTNMRFLTMSFLVLLLPSVGQTQTPLAKAVTIGKVDSIWSATLKENRPYLVSTPPSYDDTTSTPQKYPVLYLLDGDAHFH